MRVIIAGRLSRKVADRDQHGLDGQERDSVRWAEFNGHEVIAIVADFKSGRSGLESRPNLRPWVTEPAKMALYDGIVALRVDRLTRGDRAQTTQLETWARENGKYLLIAGADVRFPSEGVEGIQWDLYLRMAHQEWLNTSDRYRQMQKTIREGGGLVGKPPYGFRVVKNGKFKTLVPDPTESQVIKDAAEWYLAGVMSLDDICDRLNAAGRLPRPWNGRPSKWSAVTLSRLLRNEVLVGRRTDKEGRTILRVEPILTRAVWVAVGERITARANRKGVVYSKSPAMLTSIIKCADHDTNMYRTGSDIFGYYCRAKGCPRFIRVDVADEFVSEMMADDDRPDFRDVVVPGDDHADEIADVKRDMAEAVEAEDFDRLPALRAELERLRALPSTPARIERIRSSQTLGEVWNALEDDNARRAFLLERSARVVVGDGEFVLSIADDVETA